MQQFQRQSFGQEQRLKMHPQLYLSIKLMELPIVDLRARIEQELEKNPALEIVEDLSIVRLDESEQESERKDEYEYFESSSDPGRRGSEEAAEEHRKFIEGVLTRPETLQEHLLWQLHIAPVDQEIIKIGETLIQNLDNDGFHIEDPKTLFKKKPKRLQEAMDLVRSLDPIGCCTDGYTESLKIQGMLFMRMGSSFNSPFFNEETPSPGQQNVDTAVDNLDLLEREKFSVLAKKAGTKEEDMRDVYDFIKKLSPYPGRAFNPGEVRYVVPDVRVIRENDDFIIKLNDEAFPVLGINPFFEKLTNDPEKSKTDHDAVNFAKENVKEARIFINHLSMRNRTLLKVTNAILEFQHSFFLNGPKHLAPLTLGDIARELNVHEATISRTANGKYMQTEWGIYEIRWFFTNSISGAGSAGSSYSKESVKEMIKEIISAENRQLSDSDISALLSKKGIALARRTVAKYRKELDMGSSYARKGKIYR